MIETDSTSKKYEQTITKDPRQSVDDRVTLLLAGSLQLRTQLPTCNECPRDRQICSRSPEQLQHPPLNFPLKSTQVQGRLLSGTCPRSLVTDIEVFPAGLCQALFELSSNFWSSA